MSCKVLLYSFWQELLEIRWILKVDNAMTNPLDETREIVKRLSQKFSPNV